jgi:DNA replication and repair protein RecF
LILKRLRLMNYRNYTQVELETNHKVNIFVGPNAQGKTNLLESIYVMALTKSHRTTKDRELIQWNAEAAHLSGLIERRYGDCRLDLSLAPQGKKAKINGLEQKKLSNFVGAFNVVMFAPEDLEIVKGSPSVRRRFLDMEIAQVQPAYLHHLLQYQKILVQRNNLLKQLQVKGGNLNQTMLEVWNEQLAEHGSKIIKKREAFVYKLQKWAELTHSGITNGKEQLRIEYQPSLEVSSFQDEAMLFDQFMVKLSQVKDQELRRGATLVGPHRDDLVFYINDKEVHTFGSQGQQRTTALSLKLAEIELMNEEVGEYPVLLLDDVLSELDQYRQTQLIETFQSKVQTFITTTGIESVHLDRLDDVCMYEVHEGSVSSRD